MTPSEWVTIISVICAVITSLVGGTWILRGFISKLEKDIDERLDKMDKDTSVKVGRVYERLDQYKTFIKSKIDGQASFLRNEFVCTKVCDILHTKTAEQVAEIKGMMAEGFKRLEEKIDKS